MTRVVLMVVLLVGSSVATSEPRAQQPGVRRVDLQRHDLSVSGREVVQVRVELAPGVTFPKHTHPGEEIIYVIEGSFEYQVGDNPPAMERRRHVVHPCRGRSFGSEYRQGQGGRTSHLRP